MSWEGRRGVNVTLKWSAVLTMDCRQVGRVVRSLRRVGFQVCMKGFEAKEGSLTW